MASNKRPQPFAPSNYLPEKRTVQYSIRMTDTELALLEREAAKRGITSLNLVRSLLSEGLAPKRKSRR